MLAFQKQLCPLILVLVLSAGCGTSSRETCIDKNCSDYASQLAAQQDFDENPECRNDLDGDSDGQACEQWFEEDDIRGDCPKTSNCGCSNIRKDECASGCCQWVVGEGCRCS